MSLFDIFKRKGVNNTIVQQLEDLGYFKYADKADIPALKKEITESLKENWLSSVYNDEKPWNSKDYRHYSLDGEELFEEGGFISTIKDFKPLFNKMRVTFEIADHVEDWDHEKGLNHHVTVNGKRYIIFQNFGPEQYGWDEAGQRLAEIVNDQLELQHKDERMYLINGGNDGRCVFLTEQQFKLLDPILTTLSEKPFTVDDWCRKFGVDKNNYLH
jgi:hypothetical protein